MGDYLSVAPRRATQGRIEGYVGDAKLKDGKFSEFNSTGTVSGKISTDKPVIALSSILATDGLSTPRIDNIGDIKAIRDEDISSLVNLTNPAKPLEVATTALGRTKIARHTGYAKLPAEVTTERIGPEKKESIDFDGDKRPDVVVYSPASVVLKQGTTTSYK